MSQHDITVLIPVLNAGRFLVEALESVRAQSGHRLQLIVIDDGSDDDSPRVAAQFADVVLTTAGREGPSAARNRGAKVATGDLLAFLDADDRWLPGHLDAAVRALDGAPDATACFSRVQAIGDDSYVSDAGPTVPHWAAFDPRVALCGRNIVTQITTVVRRDDFHAVGGYDEARRYAEDYDLWHVSCARMIIGRLAIGLTR